VYQHFGHQGGLDGGAHSRHPCPSSIRRANFGLHEKIAVPLLHSVCNQGNSALPPQRISKEIRENLTSVLECNSGLSGLPMVGVLSADMICILGIFGFKNC